MNMKEFLLSFYCRAFRVILPLLLVFTIAFGGQALATVQASFEPQALTQTGGDPDNQSNLLAGQRTLSFPANALNYDKASTILTQVATGIRWQASFQSQVFLTIPRPTDWDGTSDVTLRLFFYPATTPEAGSQVSFFIRPRAYDPGDFYYDAPALNSAAVPVTAERQTHEQDFTIPASHFGAKAQWVIAIQREGTGETYTDEVVLTSVKLSYLTKKIFLPLVYR